MACGPSVRTPYPTAHGYELGNDADRDFLNRLRADIEAYGSMHARKVGVTEATVP